MNKRILISLLGLCLIGISSLTCAETLTSNTVTLVNAYNQDLRINLNYDIKVTPDFSNEFILHPGEKLSSSIKGTGEVYFDVKTIVDPLHAPDFINAYFAVSNNEANQAQLHCYLDVNMAYTCPQTGPLDVIFKNISQ